MEPKFGELNKLIKDLNFTAYNGEYDLLIRQKDTASKIMEDLEKSGHRYPDLINRYKSLDIDEGQNRLMTEGRSSIKDEVAKTLKTDNLGEHNVKWLNENSYRSSMSYGYDEVGHQRDSDQLKNVNKELNNTKEMYLEKKDAYHSAKIGDDKELRNSAYKEYQGAYKKFTSIKADKNDLIQAVEQHKMDYEFKGLKEQMSNVDKEMKAVFEKISPDKLPEMKEILAKQDNLIDKYSEVINKYEESLEKRFAGRGEEFKKDKVFEKVVEIPSVKNEVKVDALEIKDVKQRIEQSIKDSEGSIKSFEAQLKEKNITLYKESPNTAQGIDEFAYRVNGTIKIYTEGELGSGFSRMDIIDAIADKKYNIDNDFIRSNIDKAIPESGGNFNNLKLIMEDKGISVSEHKVLMDDKNYDDLLFKSKNTGSALGNDLGERYSKEGIEGRLQTIVLEKELSAAPIAAMDAVEKTFANSDRAVIAGEHLKGVENGLNKLDAMDKMSIRGGNTEALAAIPGAMPIYAAVNAAMQLQQVAQVAEQLTSHGSLQR